MEEIHHYTKLRRDYGRQSLFCETGPEFCDNIPVNKNDQKTYMLRNPVHSSVNCSRFSHHEVNTNRIEYTTTGCNHIEGGWPKDVKIQDRETTERYRRKIQKEGGYINCVMSTVSAMEKLIQQNNAIDIYKSYF